MTKKNKGGDSKHKPVQVISLLDAMIDGKEYESLLSLQNINIDVSGDIRRAIKEIERIRGRKNIVYAGNIIKANPDSPINNKDDLPFKEMIDNVQADAKELDVILVTNGGSGEQVTRFVDALRPRFDSVDFILPSNCMSAGTLWALSGNNILMDARAVIGPIDPQIPGNDGRYLPAQSIMTLLKEIQDGGALAISKGETIQWSLVRLLDGIDKMQLGSVISMTKYGMSWAAFYLENYKFRTWSVHESSQLPVTPDEKRTRAGQIASLLANNESFYSHGHGITRETAWSQLRLKIQHPEDTPGLQRALRRLWALLYYSFERTPLVKILISENYGVFFHSAPLPGGGK